MADLIAQWSNLCITDKGLELRQRVLGQHGSIRFVYAELGSGVPAEPTDIWSMTALMSFEKQVPVKQSYAKGQTHFITVLIDNLGYEEEILMRELAVYAQEEDGEGHPLGAPVLYAYAYTEHGYEPIPAGSSFRRIWELKLGVGISRSMEVKVLFDQSGVYITPLDLDTRMEPLEPDYLLAEFSHKMGGYPNVTVFGTLLYGYGMGGAGDGPAGGTAMEQVPVKVVWLDIERIALYTTKAAAHPDAQKQVYGNGTTWLITYEDDPLASLYIVLTNGQSTAIPPSTAMGKGIVFTNLVLSETPPEDSSAIWGEPK